MRLAYTTLAIAVIAAALGGCAMHDRGYSDTARVQGEGQGRPVASPAMEPDRQNYDRPRSFRDPGPNYPDTGR